MVPSTKVQKHVFKNKKFTNEENENVNKNGLQETTLSEINTVTKKNTINFFSNTLRFTTMLAKSDDLNVFYLLCCSYKDS